MYEHCTICSWGDIRKMAQHCGYETFRCEDCGHTFGIDDCYVDFESTEDGYKAADEEDY